MSTLAGRPATSTPRRSSPGVPGRRSILNWQVRFAILSLIWGFSFLFIKVGTEAFAPLQVTLARTVFGSAVLGAVLFARRARLPRRPRTWAHLAVVAFLLNALPFSLFAYSELTISSTLAGICNATTPLWSMLLSMVALSEDRPTRRRFAGVGIGFLGVLTVLGAWQGFSGQDLLGTALALIAGASYAVGWIYVRRALSDTGESSLSLSTGQLLLATLQLAVVTPLFTSAPHAYPLASVLSVVALGALGTGLAFLLQYEVVKEAGPTVATMVTYLIPVIATAAGVFLLGEQLSWYEPVGAVVVLLGAALTQTSPETTKAATPAHAGSTTTE